MLLLSLVPALALEPLNASSLAVRLHVGSALAALIVGVIQLTGRKGSATHRQLGWLWCGLMISTALSSFAIVDWRNPQPTALILLLSFLVLIQVPLAIQMARRRRIEAHRKIMTGMFIGGLLVAGGFTLLPGRLMHTVLFG